MQPWFIVVGFGAKSGVPHRNSSDAFDSFYRANKDIGEHGTLYAASTERAARAADVSQTEGGVKQGRFWRVGR